jgi:hypothetical protein
VRFLSRTNVVIANRIAITPVVIANQLSCV